MSKFEGVFILTDMDGTLLDSSASIAPRDAAAIDYFIENGGCFSVATGRARGSVERFLPDLHTSAPSIVDNGAWISDLRTGETLRLAAMGSEAADMVEDIAVLLLNVNNGALDQQAALMAGFQNIQKYFLLFPIIKEIL